MVDDEDAGVTVDFARTARCLESAWRLASLIFAARLLYFIVTSKTSKNSKVRPGDDTAYGALQAKKMHAGTGGNEPEWCRFSAGSSTAFVAIERNASYRRSGQSGEGSILTPG